MRNIVLKIEYDGTRYHGWQIQRKKSKEKTIQSSIEEALKKILQENIRLIASGRTDAGVHAEGQIANFKTNSRMPAKDIMRALNAVLPNDIAIILCKDVRDDFHARFDAKSKLYRYCILNRPCRSVFLKDHTWHIPHRLNLNNMKKAARLFVGRRNLKSFQSSAKDAHSSIRTIKKIKIHCQGGIISIDIEADGFLYNMARNIVGTLVEVAKEKLSVGDFKDILVAKDRRKAGPAAPAKGLSLVKVKYQNG